MPADSNESNEYVLGTQEDEAMRLGLQHSLWSEYAHAIWKRAGIGFGTSVLDAGSGPGFGTLDLARLVGPEGQVTALEYSPVFVASLQATIDANQVPGIDTGNITVTQADLQNVEFAPEIFDAAYLRWVLCFLKDPKSALVNIARGLKPGGCIAIQDYSNFIEALTLHPKSVAFEKVAHAFHEGWLASGGNSRIGLELPGMLHDIGFEVEETNLLNFAIRPQDSLWRWPESFFPIVANGLVEKGVLSDQDREDFLADWRARSTAPDSLFCTPIVLEIIARKNQAVE